MTYVRLFGLVLLLLAGTRMASAQPEPSGVVVVVQPVPVQTLRIADFDPLSPELAPIVINITLHNDARVRELSIEALARTERAGVLMSARARLGRVAPNMVVMLTNRDFTDYELGDETDAVLQVALERGTFPADEYIFEVRVFDHSIQPRGVEIAFSDGMIETTNPGLLFDLIGPGVPFGQEPDVVPSPNPIFQWVSDASAFDFALYEVRPDQRSPEDVVSSRPVFQRERVMMSTFAYPNAAEDLVPGTLYAWQVQARVLTAAGEVTRPSELFWFLVEGQETSARADQANLGAPPFAGGQARRLTIEPQEIELPPGGTFPFRATAYDANDVALLVTAPVWSVRQGNGSITRNGLFTAGPEGGVVAVTARLGEASDFATVFVQDNAPAALIAADTSAAAAGDIAARGDTLDLFVSLLVPVEGQELFSPIPTFVWTVTGADSTVAPRFAFNLWPADPALPPDAVPDLPPLYRANVTGTTLVYPGGAPLLEHGNAYVVRIDVVDATGAVLASSIPSRFSIPPLDKIGWDLWEAWQAQPDATARILAELSAPPLGPLERQQLTGAAIGAQIEIEAGPWLQMSVPLANLSAVAGLNFISLLTLPAPPMLSDGPTTFTEAQRPSGPVLPLPDAPAPPPPTEYVAPAPSPSDHAPVTVAIFEFGFDEDAIRALPELGSRDVSFRSFRQDGRVDGGDTQGTTVAGHGVATVRAMLDYLPPEADLHLINFATELEFLEAVSYATDELDTRVITCSVSWMNAYDHYDGTSYFFGEGLQERLGSDVVMVAAAGNFAQSHWEGAFADTDRDRAHDFDGTGTLALDLSPNRTYTFLLSWDGWENLDTDLDLLLTDEAGAVLRDRFRRPVKSANRQGERRFRQPVERIRSFRPDSAATYHLRIDARQLGSAEPNFELYLYPWPEKAVPAPMPESSLAGGLSTAPAVLSATATGFTHSSQGPTNDGRIRPDFAADGLVSMGGTRRQGTSFATPRVAAAFAMIFSKHPDWSTEQALDLLKRHSAARDKDNRQGWGAIDFEGLVRALSL